MKPKNEKKRNELRNRRDFLKSAARKAVVPVVAAYSVKKTTPNLFAAS